MTRFYIDGQGDGENYWSGKRGAPWKDLDGFIAGMFNGTVQTGDTVEALPGADMEHDGSLIIDVPGIIFRALGAMMLTPPTPKPIIRAPGYKGIQIDTTSVTVAGFEIPESESGVDVTGNGGGFKVLRMNIHDHTKECIGVGSLLDGLVAMCHLHAGQGDAVNTNRCGRVRVIHNLIEALTGLSNALDAIAFHGANLDWNEVHWNVIRNFASTFKSCISAGPLLLGGTWYGSKVRASHNLLMPEAAGQLLNTNSSNTAMSELVAWNNLLLIPAANFSGGIGLTELARGKFFTNTMVNFSENGGASMGSISREAAADQVFKGNISLLMHAAAKHALVGYDTGGVHQTFDRNLYWPDLPTAFVSFDLDDMTPPITTFAVDFATWQSAGLDVNSTMEDPRLVGQAAAEFLAATDFAPLLSSRALVGGPDLSNDAIHGDRFETDWLGRKRRPERWGRGAFALPYPAMVAPIIAAQAAIRKAVVNSAVRRPSGVV